MYGNAHSVEILLECRSWIKKARQLWLAVIGEADDTGTTPKPIPAAV